MDFKNIKIPYFKIIPVLLIAFILFRIVNNVEHLLKSLLNFFSIISYLVWGFAIAYLFNPLLVLLEKRFKLKRLWSMIISYAIYITIIFLFGWVIVPTLIKNLTELIDNMPSYFSSFSKWFDNFIKDLSERDIFGLAPFIDEAIEKFISNFSKYLNISLNLIISGTINITSLIFKFVFGFLLSIYILKDKENIIRKSKKILFALFSDKISNKIIEAGKELHIALTRYIIGRIIDSIIIGIICFCGLLLLRMPFPLIISIIVGITNLIPYFGPIIGAVPSILLVLLVNPSKVLWIAAFILILQQFDGWYLGPKILSNQVGLNPLLVITAIIIGGGLFGVIGMFLSVPFMAVIKLFADRFVDRKLKQKNIKIE